MSRFVRVLKIAGIVVAVVAAGIVVGWLGSRNPQTTAPGTSVTNPLSSATNTSAQAKTSSRGTNIVPRPSQPSVAGPDIVPEPAAANLLTNWEETVDEILTSEIPEADKAKKMLDMFPRLPEDGQVEVAQHLSNLVSDQDYGSLARFLTNSALPPPVLDVLVADALNRPNSVKLPVLLEVARDPQNPKAGEAKDVLQLFLEEDYGNDWAAWQAKLDQWLKDNPD